MLHKPAGQLVPLSRVAAIDRQAGLGVLVLCILKVTGYLLVHTHEEKSGSNPPVSETKSTICGLSVKGNSREFRELTLIMVAKYSPLMWFSVFRYRSRNSLAPTGLYLALNLSKRWKVCLPFKGRRESKENEKSDRNRD